MKILVTGASGFLGKFLCSSLQAQGHTVTKVNSKNCDLQKDDSLMQFQGQFFDRIYHLAAWTQAGDFCLYHPGEQWLINQKINTNILSYWKECQPQAKLICMGTSCSYDPVYPLKEEYYLEGRPIDSLLTYAMTKRMLLQGLEALHKQFGLQYLYLVPSTLYGPLYHTDGRQMHFIFDLIRKILWGKKHGDPVVLWGDGWQKREIIHVRDFVNVLNQLSDSVSNTLVNIGSGKEYSIREFASRICSCVGFPFPKIHFDSSRYVGAKSKVLSIEKLRKLIPDFNPCSLDDGLKETVEWFNHNRESVLYANKH